MEGPLALKDADAFAATTSVEVREGLHVADRASVTLIDAAARWIESACLKSWRRLVIADYP